MTLIQIQGQCQKAQTESCILLTSGQPICSQPAVYGCMYKCGCNYNSFLHLKEIINMLPALAVFQC